MQTVTNVDINAPASTM